MPETSESMKRPMKSDAIVKRRAWELFEPAVKRYLGNEYTDTEAPHIEKQVMGALCSGHDGYSMARQLEREGWEEDRYLMDLMDEGESFLSKAHKEILGQWVECYGIAPERKIGDRVVSKKSYGREGQVGVISKFYLDEAKYGVRYPDQPETSCYIVDYERVEDAPEVVDANAA